MNPSISEPLHEENQAPTEDEECIQCEVSLLPALMLLLPLLHVPASPAPINCKSCTKGRLHTWGEGKGEGEGGSKVMMQGKQEGRY